MLEALMEDASKEEGKEWGRCDALVRSEDQRSASNVDCTCRRSGGQP